MTDDRVDQGCHDDRFARVVLRIRGAQTSVNDRELGPRLANRDARRQSSHHVELPKPRAVEGHPVELRLVTAGERGNQRDPDVGVERVDHVRLQHPDNRERLPPGIPQAPPDKIGVTASTSPESMADDGHVFGALDIVAGLEQAPVGRRRADNIQKLGRDRHPVGGDRFVIGQHGGRRAVGVVDGGKCFEGDRLVLPDQVLGIRDRKEESAASLDVVLPDPDQTGVVVTDRLKNHRISDREEHRYGRESEAQRQNGNGRDEWSADETPKCETHIPHARSAYQPVVAPRVAPRSAKRPASSPTRVATLRSWRSETQRYGDALAVAGEQRCDGDATDGPFLAEDQLRPGMAGIYECADACACAAKN